MPLQPPRDEEPKPGASHRGAVILALSLAALLVGVTGLAGYVWLTPHPVRLGPYALVRPRYAPVLPTEGLITFSDQTPSLGPYTYSASGAIVAVNLGAASGRFQWAEVLWDGGSIKWLRVLETR